jgi:MFS family permease
MNDHGSGPQPIDWAIATIRAFHPIRWALCLLGVGVTVLALAMLQSFLEGHELRLASWWQKPVDESQALANAIAERSLLSNVVRIGFVLALLSGVWCLIGGWIARHELLARVSAQPYEIVSRPEPSPTALVIRQRKHLVVSVPTVLILLSVFLIPVLLAGGVNRIGGVGAIIVAILLPLVLLATLLLFLMVYGALAWPLMAVSIAAENSDTFDAMSRAYNYAYQRILGFLLVTALAVGVASLPLVVALVPLADMLAGWPILFWLAAGLSVSIFWSLETLVYLHLRKAVDGTDARELAVEPTETAPEPATENATRKLKPANPIRLSVFLYIMPLMVGTWFLMVWLFLRVGGEDAGWLNWGLGEQFAPQPEGLYWLASRIAAFWGVLWIITPVVVLVRSWIRGDTVVPPADAASA